MIRGRIERQSFCDSIIRNRNVTHVFFRFAHIIWTLFILTVQLVIRYGVW